MKKLVQITKTSCSEVYRLRLNRNDLFFKFLLFPKSFCINNFDLSLLLKRNRLAVSEYIYQTLKSKQKMGKYLPVDLWTIPEKNLIITSENSVGLVNLDVVIGTGKSKSFLPKISKLTQNCLLNYIKIEECPKLLNNKKIWGLKNELQLIRPLSKIMSVAKAKLLANKLGPAVYLAHGDLQPKNILINRNSVRIVDFEEGFLAPIMWDCGFLWGNILYLSAIYDKEYPNYYNLWLKLRKSITSEKNKSNFTIISIAILLMRSHLFPLWQLTEGQKNNLEKNSTRVIKYIYQ